MSERDKELIEEVKQAFEDNFVPPNERYIYCTKEHYENVVNSCDSDCYTWEEYLAKGGGSAVRSTGKSQ